MSVLERASQAMRSREASPQFPPDTSHIPRAFPRNEAEREQRVQQQRAYEAGQVEAAERQRAHARAERAERDAQARLVQEQAQSRQTEWAAERTRLEGELETAQAVQQALPVLVDLSSFDTAMESVRRAPVRAAADDLVVRCERRLADHRGSLQRR